MMTVSTECPLSFVLHHKTIASKKMYKNVLQAIDGIEIYPLISFSIFFLFFLGLIVYVVLMDKKYAKTMSSFACDEEDDNTLFEGARP